MALRARIDQRPEACGVNIEQRMQSAKREMQDYAFYDYIVVMTAWIKQLLSYKQSYKLSGYGHGVNGVRLENFTELA